MGSKLHFQRLNKIQKDAVDRTIDLLEKDGKCLIIMSTGTGKTMVGAKVIQRHKDQKILWLTQTEELISQTQQDLENIFGMGSVGLFKSDVKSLESMITIASIQTLQRPEHLKKIPKNLFDLVVVDEAHHSRALTWERVISYFKAKRLGLTATPIRNDGLGLEDLFGSASFVLDYEESKRMKLTAEEVYRLVLTNSMLEGVITKKNEYAPEALDRLVISKNRNEIIAKSYLEYGRAFQKKEGLPRKAICFCIDQQHAARMRDLFRSHGIKAESLVSGGSSDQAKEYRTQYAMKADRKKVYEEFLSGKGAEILCAVNILNEGKNIPDVGVLMLCRPTRSRIIFQQQIGRGCRRIEGKKENFLVLDYVDMMNQKYPPMSLSRVVQKDFTPENFVFDYYTGKDKKIVDQYIEYLSPQFHFHPEDKWTKPKVIDALLAFHKKYKKIVNHDLIPGRTGLPSRNTIKRFWPSVNDCFREIGLPHRIRIFKMEKAKISEYLQAFYKKNGRIKIVDLGSKNDLPSQKTIQRIWGNWTNCAHELGFKDKNSYRGSVFKMKNRWVFDLTYRGNRSRKTFATKEDVLQYQKDIHEEMNENHSQLNSKIG